MSESEAAERYRAIGAELAGQGSPVKPSMAFGMPCLKLNGKVFAGLWREAMVFKLAGEQHAAGLALPGAGLFEPMAGRPMKAWVQVPLAHAAAWPALAEQALQCVAAEAATPSPRPARRRRPT